MKATAYARKLPIKIDQGNADQFLEAQLKPAHFLEAANKNGYDVEFESHEGYDHSYFFISSFIEQHIAFHAMCLNEQ